MGQHTYKQSTVCRIGLGHRGSHPTGGELTWGNALCTHLLAQGSVGLASSG